jgi:branched-subunit amino acid transport protein
LNETLWLVVAGMTAVTVLPRVLPILLLSGWRLPRFAERWLALIAPAVLSALLLPELLPDAGAPLFSASNTFLWASVPAFLAAWRTKSLFGTVAAGIVSAALLRAILTSGFLS